MDGIEHFTCLTETGVVTPHEVLVDVVSAGITVDLTLGIGPSQAPPPDQRTTRIVDGDLTTDPEALSRPVAVVVRGTQSS